MAESPSSALPRLQGLTIEAVEWLPSGADSGLVRVRGRWSAAEAARPGLPGLVVRAGGADHRFESLPDARFARDPASWRGSYLVPVALVAAAPELLWVEWPGGVRSGLPPLAPGLATPPVPEPPVGGEEPEGGQLIDRAVLAERRARRAEASEQGQARVAAEALRAVEALELQSAELERRLAEATVERDAMASGVLPIPSGAPPSAEADARAPELERLAERRQAALTGALDSLARLRAQSREWRLKLRTGEIAHAGDAVRLAVLEAERSSGGASRAARHERELEAARAEADRGRVQLEEAREHAEGRLAAALAAAEATRANLDRRRRGERAVHEEVRQALGERLDAATRRAAALEAAQVELATTREAAEARAGELRARVTDLEAALTATETRLHTVVAAATATETRLHTAEAAATATEARLRVESVARAALENELDRDREARAALATELGAEREALAAGLAAERQTRAAERDAAVVERDQQGAAAAAVLAAEREARALAEVDLVAERERRAAAEAALEEGRSSFEADLAAARAALDADREELDRVRAELAAERQARLTAEEAVTASRHEGHTLQDRIAELDRRTAGLAAEVRLEQAARDQADAAAASARRPDAESGRMVADIEAAAAALREAAPEPPPAEPVTAAPEPPVEPVAAAPAPPAEPPVPAAAPPPRERTRPVIVSAAGHPPRMDAVGRSARQYPPLRGAIVKLAHDDPVAAGRLIAALLPVQAAALANALDYDLTIREVGTYSVTVAGTWTHVKPLAAPRPRGESDFHLTADALTLAELLAGVPRHVGRLFGPARFRGSKRRLNVLKALSATSLSVAEAARAGAQLEPGLVYRALAYAVHPSWTKGERFTIAQEITGETPETWFLTARDGAGLAISSQAPPEGPDATVSMTRAAFELLLRGEPLPRGARPSVRGDRRVVARMKAWTEQAQGLPSA